MARYMINGIEYPSVTEILDITTPPAGLMYWALDEMGNSIKENCVVSKDGYYNVHISDLEIAKKAHKEIKEEAADIGTEVHHLIERYIKNGDEVRKMELRDEVMKAMCAFWDWEALHNVKWLESEMTIVDPELGYAGTLDAIALVDGFITVIDFKSSKKFYKKNYTQCVAYAHAQNRMRGRYHIQKKDGSDYLLDAGMPGGFDCIGVLRLDKFTGLSEWYYLDNQREIERRYQEFQALLNFYYLEKNRRLKNNPIAEAIKKQYK